MLKHVSKHLAVAAERNRASLGVVWVVGKLVSTDVNVTGHACTDTIYRRLVKNQDLANERGTLCVDAIFDMTTIQNPVK
jgi:hypothetical protein